MDDKKKLLALCLDDMVKRIGQPQDRKMILELQNYTIICVLNKLDKDIQRKIHSDQVLSDLLYNCPYLICPNSSDFLDHPFLDRPTINSIYVPTIATLSFNHLYSHDPPHKIKYISTWKQIYDFIQGTRGKWWKNITSNWIQETALNFNCSKHHHRQKEREIAVHELAYITHNIPHFTEDLIYIIITYL